MPKSDAEEDGLYEMVMSSFKSMKKVSLLFLTCP